MRKNTEWVDFKKVKERVSMLDIINHYGLGDQLQRKEYELIGYCPIHDKNHYNKNIFRVNTSKNAWHCFACGRGG